MIWGNAHKTVYCNVFIFENNKRQLKYTYTQAFQQIKHTIKYLERQEVQTMGVVAGSCGGFGTSTGIILVLYILLVIILSAGFLI